MKNFLLTIAAIGGMATSSFAQTTGPTTQSSGNLKRSGKWNIGIEGGLPLGDASSVYNGVIGGSVKYEFPTAPNAFFTISAGYNAYLIKSEFKEPGTPSTSNFIPIKAGAKYYSDGGFFLQGELGVEFATEKDGSHAFVFAPGVGYTFNGGFETGLRYEGWVNGGTIGQLSLRLGYRF